jgi:hypothetical protein
MSRRLANYQEDVHNKLYREAEDRVLAYLHGRGKQVKDCRPERTFYDFIIGSAWTLDVKCDTRYVETGRVAWEQLLIKHAGGVESIIESWGMHHGLSYIAYALCPPEGQREGPWTLIICHADRLRQAVLGHKEEPACKEFITRGTDRDGVGYAVDVAWLRAQGNIILEEGEC